MATVIDTTFFNIDPFIAQMGQLSVQENVQLFIARYEPKFLAVLLGNKTYLSLVAALEEPVLAEPWKSLVEGKTYEDDKGSTFIWPGLANPGTKVSAIANYVYYWYARSEASWATGSGEVVPDVENGTRNSPADKQVQIWADMVRLNYQCLHFLQTHKDEFPDWKGYGWMRADYEYFFDWWPRYIAYPYGLLWWPSNRGLVKPDIFQNINTFNL